MVISDRVLLAFFLVSLPCILTYVFLFKICQIRLGNFRKKRKSMTRQRENKEFEKRRYAEGPVHLHLYEHLKYTNQRKTGGSCCQN